MKKYITPEIEMAVLASEDVMTASQTTVMWNADAEEYWVGAAEDWWN